MKRHSSQSGMTLIEILIVVLVFSLGMVGTAKFQGDLLHEGGTTKARMQALTGVQQQLESLRMATNPVGGTQDDVSGINAQYDLAWTVSSGFDGTGATAFGSQVDWTDTRNRTQQVQLSTVLYADRMLTDTQDAVQCVLGNGCFVQGKTPPKAVVVSIVEEDVDNPSDGWTGVDDASGDTTFNSNKNVNQSITFTDTDDKVYVGKNINGNTNLGGGDNILYVDDNVNGSITAGDGSDQIEIGNNANGDIDLGNGNNKLKIDNNMNGNIILGSGSDLVAIDNNMNKGPVYLGDGNNYMEIGNNSNVAIYSGSGNDTVTIQKHVNGGPVDLGDGNNILDVGGSVHTSVIAGKGSDYIKITDNKNGGSLLTDDGNDYLYIGGNNNSSIEMGEGDDFVCILGNFSHPIDGGVGNDSIYIGKFTKSEWDSNGNTWRHQYVKDFENIKFKDGSVIGDASAFDDTLDDGCLKSKPAPGSSDGVTYTKKYIITVEVEFNDGEAVTSATVQNLVPDSMITGLSQEGSEWVLPIDDQGNAQLELLTETAIPSDKEVFASTQWYGDNNDKLRVIIELK